MSRQRPKRDINLTISSEAANLSVVRAAIEKLASLVGFCQDEVDKISLAVDEALSNVIKHGYSGQEDGQIVVSLQDLVDENGKRALRINVRDFGRQVDPRLIKGRDLDDVRPGGLGVHIIRSVMDEVCYSCPPDGGMLLEMVKFVNSCDEKPC